MAPCTNLGRRISDTLGTATPMLGAAAHQALSVRRLKPNAAPPTSRLDAYCGAVRDGAILGASMMRTLGSFVTVPCDALLGTQNVKPSEVHPCAHGVAGSVAQLVCYGAISAESIAAWTVGPIVGAVVGVISIPVALTYTSDLTTHMARCIGGSVGAVAYPLHELTMAAYVLVTEALSLVAAVPKALLSFTGGALGLGLGIVVGIGVAATWNDNPPPPPLHDLAPTPKRPRRRRRKRPAFLPRHRRVGSTAKQTTG